MLDRDVTYAVVRVVTMAVLALILGLLFRDIGTSDEFGLISKMASIFVTAGFVSFTVGSMSMPVILRVRECFYKEQASHVYAGIWHANALALVELPYLAASLLLYCIPIYFLIGFESRADFFFQYYAVMLLAAIYASYLGQALASLAPNLQVANVLFPLIMTLHFVFGGVFVLKDRLPGPWRFMWYLSPLAKALNSVSLKQFECEGADCPTVSSVQFGGEMTQWEFVQQYLSSGPGWDKWWALYLLLQVVVMRIIASFVILKVSHYSR